MERPQTPVATIMGGLTEWERAHIEKTVLNGRVVPVIKAFVTKGNGEKEGDSGVHVVLRAKDAVHNAISSSAHKVAIAGHTGPSLVAMDAAPAATGGGGGGEAELTGNVRPMGRPTVARPSTLKAPTLVPPSAREKSPARKLGGFRSASEPRGAGSSGVSV